MIYLWCVTGTRSVNNVISGSLVQTKTNTSTSFGWAAADSEDEAVGKAIKKFTKDTPEHEIQYYKVVPHPELVLAKDD